MSIPAANSLCRGGFLGFVGLVYFFPGVPWWLGVMVFGVASCYLQLPRAWVYPSQKNKNKNHRPRGQAFGGLGRRGGYPKPRCSRAGPGVLKRALADSHQAILVPCLRAGITTAGWLVGQKLGWGTSLSFSYFLSRDLIFTE